MASEHSKQAGESSWLGLLCKSGCVSVSCVEPCLLWANYWGHSLFPLPPPPNCLNLAEARRKWGDWQNFWPIRRRESCKWEALWDHTYPLLSPPSPHIHLLPSLSTFTSLSQQFGLFTPPSWNNFVLLYFAWGPTLTCTLFSVTHSLSIFAQSHMTTKYLICEVQTHLNNQPTCDQFCIFSPWMDECQSSQLRNDIAIVTNLWELKSKKSIC